MFNLMKRSLKFSIKLLIFTIITILTQVGGIVFLLSLFLNNWINKKTEKSYLRFIYKFFTFILLYLSFTFLVIPVIARPFGRVPLPLLETHHLQPLNVLTCVLNRHYVNPELKQTAFEVAEELNTRFPGTVVNYLDANFPFIDNFPLAPHLSHNDGKKLDLSFCYRVAASKEPTNDCPSFIGYGISEDPTEFENNTAEYCDKKGYWQYGILTSLVNQSKKKDFSFDHIRTAELVKLFAKQSHIGKIFIEPHLKTRLKLNSEKIRFHGCQAVRHDDHIHIQL